MELPTDDLNDILHDEEDDNSINILKDQSLSPRKCIKSLMLNLSLYILIIFAVSQVISMT